MVEFENGDLMSGFFDDGRRKGEFRVETFKNNLRVIIGNYERDQLNGKARVGLSNICIPVILTQSHY